MAHRLATRLAKQFLPEWIRFPYRYLRLRHALRMRSLRDILQRSRYPGVPIPPALLRYRAEGSVISAHLFLNTGLNCAQNVRSALGRIHRNMEDFERVLDFGCGCGRVLRWFREAGESCRITGTDIDKKAVAWCRRRLPFAEFEVNGHAPPLSHDDGTFDLIMNLSTIDHFDESLQMEWIKELKRLAGPGGIVLATFYGRTARWVLRPDEKEEVKEKGILYKSASTGLFKTDGLPDYYQISFQTGENALEKYSRFFKVLDHIEGGFANFEDLLVLEKK